MPISSMTVAVQGYYYTAYASSSAFSSSSSGYIAGLNFTYSTDYSALVEFVSPIKGYYNDIFYIKLLSFVSVPTTSYSVSVGK